MVINQGGKQKITLNILKQIQAKKKQGIRNAPNIEPCALNFDHNSPVFWVEKPHVKLSGQEAVQPM